MTAKTAMSRRHLLVAGAGSLAVACGGAAGAPATAPPVGSAAAPTTGSRLDLIRRWYGAWEKKDWATADALMTADFAFSSAAGDDHISKTTFKAQCWDTQIAFIDRVDLETVLDNGHEALVKYLGHTKNGKSFRNVEHFDFRGDQIAALECYFGEQSAFPSAVTKKS